MKALLSQLVINWSGLCHFAMTAAFTRAAPAVWLSPLSILSGCSFFQEFYILGNTTGKLLRGTLLSHWLFLLLVLAHSVPPNLSDSMRRLLTLEMTSKFTWFAKLGMKCLVMREWWWFFSALFFLSAPILLPHSHMWQSCFSPWMGDPKFQHTWLQEQCLCLYT